MSVGDMQNRLIVQTKIIHAIQKGNIETLELLLKNSGVVDIFADNHKVLRTAKNIALDNVELLWDVLVRHILKRVDVTKQEDLQKMLEIIHDDNRLFPRYFFQLLPRYPCLLQYLRSEKDLDVFQECVDNLLPRYPYLIHSIREKTKALYAPNVGQIGLSVLDMTLVEGIETTYTYPKSPSF